MKISHLRALLVLFILTFVSKEVSTQLLRDFKTVLMYYAEPFLNGVSIYGPEGENSGFVADKIAAAIDQLEKNGTEFLRSKDLFEFKEALKHGIVIETAMNSRTDSAESLAIEAKSVQISFQTRLEKFKYIVIPYGWKKHAVALSFRFNESSDTVDFVVHNAGDGIDFHYHSTDPDGIYPFLSRTWIEFKDIPKSEILSDDAWFFQGLMALQTDLAEKLEKNDKTSIPVYFYGSFLPNFRKYLAPLDTLDTSKHVPMQRSGTCTIASILAALLYNSESMQVFQLHRLKIGHILIQNLIDGGHSDEQFKKAIRDGFEGQRRGFLLSLSSNLAQQTLQYLESVLPAQFKHAGLIGTNRSAWLYQHKTAAIKALKENKDILLNIQTSIILSNRIFKYLNDLPISSQSTKVHLGVDSRKGSQASTGEVKGFVPMKVNESTVFSDVVDHLTGLPSRIDKPISNLVEFQGELRNRSLITENNSQFFFRVADIFTRAGPAWWTLIDEARESDKFLVLNILESLQKLSRKLFSSASVKKTKIATCFDNLALMAQFQLAAWKAAVKSDLFSKNSIGLNTCNPPETIKITLGKSFRKNILATNRQEWAIDNIFSVRSISSLAAVLHEFKRITNEDYFPFKGPESYVQASKSFDARLHFSLNPPIPYIEKMVESPEAIETYQDKLACENDEERDLWKESNEKDTKIYLIMSSEPKIVEAFPHFYALINILTKTWIAATVTRRAEFNLQKIIPPKASLWNVQICNTLTQRNEHLTSETPYKVIKNPSLIRDIVPVFFLARYSFALTPEVIATSVETWLNYIKVASSARMFDNPYFQYVTDHLLNVPKYEEFDDQTFEYKLRFSKNLIEEIYESMLRLVGLSLNRLREKKNQLDGTERSAIVSRATNIAILLIRFISRIEHGELLPAKQCAQVLANLYNVISPYSHFKSDLELTEPDISRLNLALCHASLIPLRNSLDFMLALDLSIPEEILKHRRTLEKYHWFATKMAYQIHKLGESISDDQFNYGIVERELCKDEVPFLEALLSKFFLPAMAGPVQLDNFKYHKDGFKVEVHSTDNESVIINLSTGAIVRSGLTIMRNNQFLNAEPFMNFFKLQDRSLVSNGIAVMAAGRSIYALPEYKGSSYLIVNRNTNESTKVSTTIHRKWKTSWYTWSESHEEFQAITNYKWTHGMKLFTRISGNMKEKDMIIYEKDEDKDPIVHLSIKDSKIKIEVMDLLDRHKTLWTMLAQVARPFEKHIRAFVEEDFIQFKDPKTQRLGVIYPGYRLPEDPMRPMTILEDTDDAKENVSVNFKVLNVPGLSICLDQSLWDQSSLPGALVASHDSKKVLLLPQIENESKKFKPMPYKPPPKEKLIQIQKVPIIEGVPSPQARSHKLLLAYYYILAHKYYPARELLHPSASLHQNEAFSVEELEILSWIVQVNYSAPEVLALKLLVLMLYRENASKFPIEYETRAEAVELICEKINVNAKKETFSYLLSIREVSEKFYIYRMYPEILKQTTFNFIFENAAIKVTAPKSTEASSYDIFSVLQMMKASDSAVWELGIELKPKYFYDFVSKGPSKELSLARRFVHRRYKQVNLNSSFEMAVYCYAMSPGLWAKFKETCDKSSFENFSINEQCFLSQEFNRKIEECHNIYSDDFKSVDQSVSTTNTDLNVIYATMQADFNRFSFETDDPANIEIPPLVSEAEIKKIISFKDKLEAVIKNDKKDPKGAETSQYFDVNLLVQGTVLKKLSEAISAFILEKGPNRLTEVKLSASLLEELTELDLYFSERIDALKQLQNESKTDLLQATQEESKTKSLSSVIDSIVGLMHKRKPKTFSSLYTCYFGNYSAMLACIQRKFPQLSLMKCQKIKNEAFRFFSRQVLLDYLTMLKGTSQGFLVSPSNSVDDLTIFCDELDKIADFNKRIKDPVVMSFEFRSAKYRLKREQVVDVTLLTSIDPQTQLFKSTVIQRMMAAGKTLVLGTISIVKKALDNDKLSILVPPSSLYQSNTTAMQNRTYQYFKKKGKNFSFPRFLLPTATSKSGETVQNYLNMVQDMIKETMSGKNYLILSPDALHSFLNSYIEVIMNAEDNKTTPYHRILKGYAWIYRVFKRQSSIILDEIDMTMDPRKELNFPTLDSEPYNMIAAAMISDIMEFLVFDERVIKEANLHIHSNNQASLTPENYVKCREIILNYIESQIEDEKSLWFRLLFAGTRHVATSEQVMTFLRNPRMSQGKDLVELIASAGDDMTANALIIVKVQLHQYFEDSLKGTVNQNFGSAGKLRPEIKYAVPYVAANTPSPASVFADRWETLLKTLLMVSAVPCSEDLAKDIIEFVRRAMVHESSGAHPLESTATYKNLNLFLPVDLNPVTLDKSNQFHVVSVWKGLSERSPAAIRILYAFYMNQVFKSMTFPVEQITSNALHMTSMFGSVQGYSGTIDNVNILPRAVVKDAYEDHLRNEKNNGGISLKLIKDFNDAIVPELSLKSFDKNVLEMVRDLMALYDESVLDSLSAIIDVGAFFKNFKNRQIAEAILTIFSARIEAVLYYDEDSNQLEFVRRSGDSSTTRGFLDTTDPDDIRKATQADILKRFTFYDQRHITGSDILQFKTARAILTVGSRVLLRDMLQGTLRMRQFMTSQKVHLTTTMATRLFYANKIRKADAEVPSVKISDLLTLGSLNEDDKQRHENEKLAFAKIDTEIRAFVLDEISQHLLESSSDITSFDLIIELFESCKSLFVRSIRESPMSWLYDSKLDDSIAILKIFAISRLDPLSRVIESKFFKDSPTSVRFNSLKGRILAMISPDREHETDCLLHYLPKQIRTRIEQENGNEVQMQTLTLTLIDLNLDQLIDKMDSLLTEKAHPLEQLLPEFDLPQNSDSILKLAEAETTSFVSLYKVLTKDPNLNQIYRPYLDAALLTMGRRIFVSKDMVQMHETNRMKTYPIFSKYTLEASHLLVENLPSSAGVRAILLSPKSAEIVFIALSTKAETLKNQFWLCDLTGRVTATNTEGLTENVLDFIPSVRELVFDALIFNGSLTHILNNPVLKAIYYDQWLADDTFKERATFVLLRMKVLMEKDKFIFEDDDQDYAKLKRFARGDRSPDTVDNFSEGYPKVSLSESDQAVGIERVGATIKPVELAPEPLKHFDLNAEILNLFEIVTLNRPAAYSFKYGLEIESRLRNDNNIDPSELLPTHVIKMNPLNVIKCVEDCRPIEKRSRGMSDPIYPDASLKGVVLPTEIYYDKSLPIDPPIGKVIFLPSEPRGNLIKIEEDEEKEEPTSVVFAEDTTPKPEIDDDSPIGGGGGGSPSIVLEEESEDEDDIDIGVGEINLGGRRPSKPKPTTTATARKTKTPTKITTKTSTKASSSSVWWWLSLGVTVLSLFGIAIILFNSKSKDDGDSLNGK